MKTGKLKVKTEEYYNNMKKYLEEELDIEDIKIEDDMLFCYELSIEHFEDGAYGLCMNDDIPTSCIINIASNVLWYSKYILNTRMIVMECMSLVMDENDMCLGCMFEDEYDKQIIIKEECAEIVNERITDDSDSENQTWH